MSLLPVYFNESSLPSQGLDRHSLVECVVCMIAALHEISKVADEFVVGSRDYVSAAGLSEGYETLASLKSEIDRDWWRVFRGFDNRSPFDEVPHAIAPGVNEEVEICGAVGEGALWAHRNAALLLSLPWAERFTKMGLSGILREIVDSEIVESEIQLRQVSTVETAIGWKEYIECYGAEETASSLVFEDERISVRMYLNDHEPPHVHIFLPSEPRKCRAKIRFDKAEFLKNTLPESLSSYIVELVVSHKDELERGWHRCRAGRKPLRLQGGAVNISV